MTTNDEKRLGEAIDTIYYIARKELTPQKALELDKKIQEAIFVALG